MPNASMGRARSSPRGRRHDDPDQLEGSWRNDARRMAQALERLGVEPGDRVATLAMNHDRHLAAWFGVVGMGGVLHTLNPRLFDDQLAYIVNHAEDRVLLYDAAFAAARRAAEAAAGRRSRITSASTTSSTIGSLPRTAIIAGTKATSASRAASATPAARPATRRACSTSIARPCSTRCRSSSPDIFDLSARSVMLPVVPMFHANSWCLPYAAAIAGLKLVICADNSPSASAGCSTRRASPTRQACRPSGWT